MYFELKAFVLTPFEKNHKGVKQIYKLWKFSIN